MCQTFNVTEILRVSVEPNSPVVGSGPGSSAWLMGVVTRPCTSTYDGVLLTASMDGPHQRSDPLTPHL